MEQEEGIPPPPGAVQDGQVEMSDAEEVMMERPPQRLMITKMVRMF
jgi:hypothetical protein